jgi:hypothetical protein
LAAEQATQVPGVLGPDWQMKHSSQADSQLQEPQSTVFLQLFVTEPHVPEQVLALDSAWHF